MEFVRAHYPSAEWALWCAESRPYETAVSSRLASFISGGYETCIIADNMIGYCISQKKIDPAILFYRNLSGEYALCQGGSILVAVLARELGCSCNLYPTDFDFSRDMTEDSLCFAEERITPSGARGYVPREDKVPLGYFTEKW